MADSAPDRLARTTLRLYLGLRPHERVTVETWSHALPWARAFVPEARRLGAEVALVVEDEEAFFASLGMRGARGVPRAPVGPAIASDAYVYFGGPEAYPRLFGLRSDDLESAVARHGAAWWRVARRKGLKAARMAIADATPRAARAYGVALDGWQREVLRGSAVPPNRLAVRGERWIRRLRQTRAIRIRHPNGTDLSVALGRGRGFVEDGRVDPADLHLGHLWTQVPTGLVAIPLADGGAEGVWEANRPVFDRFLEPPLAVGARFEFHDGRLHRFAFDRGGEPFARSYARGGPGRDRPGVLTLGLNPAIAHAPELADIALGTVGLLLGNNRAVGGRNRARFSYLTTLSGATVDLDGAPFLAEGREVPARAAARHRPSAR